MQQRYLYIFEMLREEKRKPGSVQWFDWKQMRQDVEVMLHQGYDQDLHEQMVVFYGPYLLKEVDSREAWYFIDFVAQKDGLIGQWATGNLDLMALTERWIEVGDSKTLLALLTRLGQTGYVANWQELRKMMDDKLCRMEVEGTRNGMKETGYFYCLLHAFIMIMIAEMPVERKMKLLELFSRQWSFLRTVYSVMVRRIVGMGYTNFAQLAQYTVGGQQDFDPFLHLFYSPLKERFEQLVEMGTKRESLQKAMLKIEQRMQQTTPSTELDELCGVLFPEELRDMLNRHRPKSYQELEGEICKIKQEMQGTIEVLNEQINALATQLSAAVKASVPVIEIEHELLRFPSQQALPIFMQLNTLLMGNEAWNQSSLTIRDKILAKQQQELQLSMTITAQAGSNVTGVVQQQTNNGLLPNKQISAA